MAGTISYRLCRSRFLVGHGFVNADPIAGVGYHGEPNGDLAFFPVGVTNPEHAGVRNVLIRFSRQQIGDEQAGLFFGFDRIERRWRGAESGFGLARTGEVASRQNQDYQNPKPE